MIGWIHDTVNCISLLAHSRLYDSYGKGGGVGRAYRKTFRLALFGRCKEIFLCPICGSRDFSLCMAFLSVTFLKSFSSIKIFYLIRLLLIYVFINYGLQLLQVWSSSVHEQEEYLDCLWAQISKLRDDGWLERHITRHYVAFDATLSDALMHNLPRFLGTICWLETFGSMLGFCMLGSIGAGPL